MHRAGPDRGAHAGGDQRLRRRGAFLALVYGLGIGIPFLVAALAFQQGMRAFSFARRHAALVTLAGGTMLVIVGVLQVTGRGRRP